jgi:hypothetical protein
LKKETKRNETGKNKGKRATPRTRPPAFWKKAPAKFFLYFLLKMPAAGGEKGFFVGQICNLSPAVGQICNLSPEIDRLKTRPTSPTATPEP